MKSDFLKKHFTTSCINDDDIEFFPALRERCLEVINIHRCERNWATVCVCKICSRWVEENVRWWHRCQMRASHRVQSLQEKLIVCEMPTNIIQHERATVVGLTKIHSRRWVRAFKRDTHGTPLPASWSSLVRAKDMLDYLATQDISNWVSVTRVIFCSNTYTVHLRYMAK